MARPKGVKKSLLKFEYFILKAPSKLKVYFNTFGWITFIRTFVLQLNYENIVQQAQLGSTKFPLRSQEHN